METRRRDNTRDQPILPPAGSEGRRALVMEPYRRQPPSRQRSADARRSPAARLEEAVGLARAIDLDVVQAGTVAMTDIRPATLLGKGKVDEIAGLVASLPAHLVIMDCAISPVQQRNLEIAWGAKVLDRTGLILEIFGRRAHTREGALQVEHAHLTYQKSRLVRSACRPTRFRNRYNWHSVDRCFRPRNKPHYCQRAKNTPTPLQTTAGIPCRLTY